MHEISFLNVVRKERITIVAMRHHFSWPQRKVVHAKLLEMSKGHTRPCLVVTFTSRMCEDDSVVFWNQQQCVVVSPKKLFNRFQECHGGLECVEL